MLGQSLGIPSRMDFQRKSRRMSVGSQSSGILSKPGTPRPGRSILKSVNNPYEYEYEYPAAALKSRSARSSSTPAPSTMYQPNISIAPQPCHDHRAAEANSCFMSGALRPPPPPPPPSPPPSQPTQFWNTQPMMSGMPAMTPGYPHMANQHVHAHGYPPQVTHAGGPPNWATQNSYTAQHYVNPLGFPVPQSTSMPLLPQQYSTYYHAVGPTLNPTHIPPPPPPPSVVRPQGFVERCVDDNEANLIKKQPKNTGKRDSSTVSKSRSIRTERRTEDSREKKLIERERISRRIRHFHICAGCGKKRSKEYQRAHPLKRGEIPEPDYCHRCIRDAIISDTESLSSLTADDASFIQFSKEAPVPRPSTDESRAAESGQYAHEKARRGPRWIKKSRRLNMLSGMLSSVTNSKVRLNSTASFSSAEESRSRASSLVPNLEVTTRALKRSGASSHPNDNRSRESMVLPEASTPIRSSHETVNKTVPNLSKPTSREMSSSPTVSHSRGRPVEKKMFEPVTSSISSRSHGMKGVAKTSQQNSRQDIPRVARQMESHVSSKAPSVAPRRMSPIVPVGNSSQVPSKVSSAGTDRKSKLPAKGIKSDDAPRLSPVEYKQPSFRNEASEVAANMSAARHETRDNMDNQRAPSQPIIETQPQSPKENSPREEFIPFPDANTESRFRNWEDTYFPMPDSPPDFKYTSKWGEPHTPSDPPHGGAAFPCFIRDSWSYSQSDIEREAEEMAEQDLAAAGKLFGDFGSSWGGSGTSCFPIPSSLTRSMISIESCDSNEYRNDRNVAYEMAEASDAEEAVGGGNKLYNSYRIFQ
ncbi:hypothetical protein F4809DRAFT_608812 [Biscogniauxia mediterranea]|nr:hypothetical protein F4809DRAFT_608812 [Biscogniauxia mediterranea]